MIGTQHAITEESTTEAATTSRLTGARLGPAGAADQVGTSLPRRASAIDALHESVVQNRRATVLAGHLAALLPAACRTVLDVGCGDGVIDALLLRHRPELTVIGLDVIERPGRGSTCAASTA